MKFDTECMRDVLLFLESEKSIITNEYGQIKAVGTSLRTISENLPQHPKEVIYYTLSRLQEAGFLNMTTRFGNNTLLACHVNYITYSGHQFIESIRDNNRWEKINGVLSAVRDYSLSAISAVAEGVTSAAITAKLSQG